MRPPRALLAALMMASCEQPAPSANGDGSAKPIASTSSAPIASPEIWRRLADRWIVGNPIPDFELTDHEGKPFQLSELAGDHVLVGLIFTHCSVPEACPRTTSRMFAVGEQWKARQKAGETHGASLRLLTLTFDPEEDTPEVLKSYSDGMRSVIPDWVFATGPTELMETRLPSMFGVIARKKDANGAIAHGVKVVLLGPGLQPLQTWTDNAFEPKDVFAIIDR